MMKYMFFDTALNGYYTLLALQKEFAGKWLPLISKEENISDDAAPFIFEITDEGLKRFLSTDHISLKEVLFLESNETITTVRDYFSRFVVQTIKGREFYFRFWAANVFVKYIATCKANQLSEFFKMVDAFYCENKGEGVRFSFDGRKLVMEKTGNDAPADSAKFSSVSDLHVERENSKEEIKKKAARKFF